MVKARLLSGLLTASSCMNIVVAADFTNIILVNLDEVGYGDH